MPHVIVKLWPGKSEQQKTRLAEEIAKNVMEILHSREESVSVAIEEVASPEWAENPYQPDIIDKSESLYKKPGYKMYQPCGLLRRVNSYPAESVFVSTPGLNIGVAF